MHSKTFLACAGMSIDRDTNQSSVFNIIEEFSQRLPAFVPEIFLYALLERDAGDGDDFDLIIECTDGAGTSVFRNDFKAEFAGRSRSRVRLSLRGFPITAAGNVTFKISRKDNESVVATYSFEVINVPSVPEIQPQQA